ncbi:MAG: hypothetical protein ACRD0N_09065 [Acidimicrobiales bacterium]
MKITLAPDLVEYVLGFPYLNPAWCDDPGFTRGKLFSRAVSKFHRECDVPACHMLSLMWGTGWPALYSHENLADVTHRRGGDLYGATSMNYYRHVKKMVSAGRAVKYEPSNPAHAALPDDYFRFAKEIDPGAVHDRGEQQPTFRTSVDRFSVIFGVTGEPCCRRSWGP